MRPLVLRVIRPVVVVCLAGCAAVPVPAPGLAQTQAPVQAFEPPVQRTDEEEADRSSPTVAVPPGALRVVNVAWRDHRAAICAEEPGPAVERARRPIRRTRVWVRDAAGARQLALGPGACDPAWSPEGDRLAVAAPDGLWVLSADLRRTTHLVDLRPVDGSPGGFERRTLSGPRWAPDASALACLVSNDRTTWVEVVDARTGARRFASDPETYEFAWEADSRSLRLGSRVVRLPGPPAD